MEVSWSAKDVNEMRKIFTVTWEQTHELLISTLIFFLQVRVNPIYIFAIYLW